MSENIHIKRRQKQRDKAFLTTRNIITLIVLSLAVFIGFRVWVGNPSQAICGDDCSSYLSLTGWVLGFFMMIGGVVIAGGIVGILLALLRRSRRDQGFEAMMNEEFKDKDGEE